MVNEPSVDASSITLTVSAFVEMDMPTTMPKMIMDDLIIMNVLEANSGVTSWSSFADDSRGLQPEHNRWSVTERSQAIEDRLPVLVAGEVVVGDEELANAGLSAIPGEGDIHAPILRLPLGRVVRCNGARLP